MLLFAVSLARKAGGLAVGYDAAVEAVYPTTFFKKTVKRTRAR